MITLVEDELKQKVVDHWYVGFTEYAMFYINGIAVCVSHNEKAPMPYVASYGNRNGGITFVYSGTSRAGMLGALKEFIKEN